MDKVSIQLWAERFVAALEVGGERVPLDRVIAAHFDELQTLRASGLTWRGIAAILTRAGGRRANGRPISPDQLRADLSRLAKRRAAATATPPLPSSSSVLMTLPPSTPVEPRPPAQPQARSRPTATASLMPPASQAPLIRSAGAKEVSDTDIAAALARLKRTS